MSYYRGEFSQARQDHLREQEVKKRAAEIIQNMELGEELIAYVEGQITYDRLYQIAEEKAEKEVEEEVFDRILERSSYCYE